MWRNLRFRPFAPETPNQRIWIGIGLIGLMLAPLFFGFRQHPSPFDDAYITYRYARNIALGNGFVYNIGESVLGTTTPLYTLLLAGLSLIWSDLPLLSHFIGVLAWTLCVPIVYGIGRVGGREAVGIIAAAFIAFNTLFLNVLGMETVLYVLLVLLTFYFYLKDQPAWAALNAGLTFLMRWDGILVVGVFLFAEVLKRRESFLRVSFICAGIIVPWLVYSYVTFGSIFPNSFFAKAGQGWNQQLGGAEIGTFFDGLLLLGKSAYVENKLFILFPAFFILGMFSVFRNKVQWWPLLLWSVAYFSGYVALGVLRFDWYYLPLVPAFALLSAEGIELFSKFISQHLGLSARQNAFSVLLGVLCLIPNVDWLLNSQRAEMDVRSTTYYEVGQWLQSHTPLDSSVAMIEIGIIGYYSDRNVVDTMGLVSPEMIGHLEGWLQTLQFAVNYYWPDYVVALEQTAWGGIVNESWFTEAYLLETKIENDADFISPVSIYRLREGFPLRDFALKYPREVVFDRAITLNEFQVAESRVEQDENLHLQLSWAAETDISTDYRLQFDLLNAADMQSWTLASNLQPMRGGNPTYNWREGDKIIDRHTLKVPPEVPAGDYLLRLNIIGKDGSVVSTFSDDALISHVAVGPIRIGEYSTDIREPAYPVTATFGDNIRLTGYDLETDPSNNLSMTLYWQATGDISRDYTAFVHLLSGDNELISQHDSPPLLPTSLWIPGIQVVDEHLLTLPTEFSPEDYQIRVGLYNWPDLERVTIVRSDCPGATTDSLLLGILVLGNAQAQEQSDCLNLHRVEREGK